MNHPPARCLEYDSLSHQAAARDPTLRWDTIKEDIYVWAITQRNNTSTSQFQPSIFNFRDRLPISACLGPPPSESSKATPPHATHTTEGKEICKRYNAGRCTRGEECIFTHICWHPGCQGEHPGKECAKCTRAPASSHPLRHSQFERELVNHSDKAWTYWLLNSIKNGVALSYDGPRGPSEARNLKSALEHTQVIDEELRKECLAS